MRNAVLATILGLGVLSTAAVGQDGHSASPKVFRPPTPAPAPAVKPGEAPAQPGAEPETVIGGIKFPTGIYDEKAVGSVQVREAAARAKKENRRILIMWGENHCGFCVHLTDVFKNDPRVKQVLAGEYEFIKIDIGKWTKHLELALFYKTDLMAMGAPTLTVVDPFTDRMVNNLDSKVALSKKGNGEVFDADVVLEFLQGACPRPVIAQTVLGEGLSRAGTAGKRALVNFSAPLCEPCDQLNGWLADPAVNAILAKAYEIIKIDVQRMTIGRDVMNRITGTKNVVEPWLVVLAADGTPVPPALATGAPVGGSAIGLPGLPRKTEQVEAFIRLVVGPDHAGGKLTADDEKVLRESIAALLPR